MSLSGRKIRQRGKIGGKSNGKIVCPVPVKPVNFGRMAMQQEQRQTPQSMEMMTTNQQQLQRQMLSEQAYWNLLQRQNYMLAYHKIFQQHMFATDPWLQLLWPRSFSQYQQVQQHQQAHHYQQDQQNQQDLAEFRANVVYRAHEITHLMAPRAQGECPEEAAIQAGLQHPHSDEAQTQHQELSLFPSPLMETRPENLKQHSQMKPEVADDEESPQFFAANANQMSLEKTHSQQAQFRAPHLIHRSPQTHEKAQELLELDRLQNGPLPLTPEEARACEEQSLCKW